ncbi:MAG: hypothetical protein ACE5HD_07945 [Acidobacteriota bacterium]
MTRESLDSRLQELIETHISSLRDDFQRLIDDLPLQAPGTDEASHGGETPDEIAQTLGRLRESVDAIHAASGQREMAERLLDAASDQAARAALLLVHNDTVRGFQGRGFPPAAGDLASFEATPEPGDPLHEVLEEHTTRQLPGAAFSGSIFSGWFTDQVPSHVSLAPVVVGDRVVAVLYADSGLGTDPGQICPESVEILAAVAGMYLERHRRLEPDGTPPVEASPRSQDPAPPVEAAPRSQDAAPQPVPGPASGTASMLETGSPEDPAETIALAHEPLLPSATDTAPAAAPPATATAPSVDTSDSPPTPIPVPPPSQEGEDARRFARLLVSEIVLYNAAQVKSGQKSGDLYDRLKGPIDRSRETYMERFGGPFGPYFDEELVRTLAEGDRSLLGDSFGQS